MEYVSANYNEEELEYLENLPYFKEQFMIASMYVNRKEHVNDIVAGNPFLESK